MAVGDQAKVFSDAIITGPTPYADWLVIAPVVLPMLIGAVLLMIRHRTTTQAWTAVAGLGLLLVVDIALMAQVVVSGPLVMTMGRWLPPFGIAFAADLLGVTFNTAGCFVAFAAAIYSVRDINKAGRRYGFYPFLLLMMAGLGGAFLTGDIFNLYVWFEVFLISSFGLLVLGSERRQIDGATKYAVLNLVATTLFLVATGYVYGTFGTLNMADIARKAAGLRDTGPLTTIAVLYLVAFGMKAAAFPLNFWLPASYHTPRIVTGALFGGLLTKVGVYALLRSLVMLFPPERAMLSGVIAWVAGLTMILGVMGALAQTDIRRLLGFLVISGIGVMLAGLAIGNEAGIAGTVAYAVHSMLAVTGLYLLAGAMNAAGGSYSLDRLFGLYRPLPLLTAMALLLVLAIGGLPPGSGLWPKVMLVRASLDAGAWWLAAAILVSSFLTVLALGRVFALAFWRDGPADDEPAEIREVATVPGVSRAALVLLCVPILILGVYPEPVIKLANGAAMGLVDVSGYVGHVFPRGAVE